MSTCLVGCDDTAGVVGLGVLMIGPEDGLCEGLSNRFVGFGDDAEVVGLGVVMVGL